MESLTKDNLKEVITNNKNVLVQFGAAWCGNCMIVKPKVSELSKSYSDVLFIYVDAEEYAESRDLADIKFLPTFASYQDGSLVGQIGGTNIDKIK